jgi:mono/diheme cytochrome c family protein
MKRLAAFLLFSAMSSAAWGQPTNSDPASAKALWDSPQLFCKNCHGNNGEGGFGPDLAGRGLSASEFQHAVRKPWGVMPTFTQEQLSDAEISGLAAYFASLPKVPQAADWRVPLTPDLPHGQQVYISAGCGQCHGATFDMPRASLGGRNGDFALMKELVYTHTDAMPKFEEQRPGQRLRMGNFDSLRLSNAQLKEIYDWAHDEIGFRPDLQARLTQASGATYSLQVTNQGEAGKGLTAQGITIDLVIPVDVTVASATGDGYKGVHSDPQAKATVAEWRTSSLAPKGQQAFTITLSQVPANPTDLKGSIRWDKPAPKTGPNADKVNFAFRPAGAARP